MMHSSWGSADDENLLVETDQFVTLLGLSVWESVMLRMSVCTGVFFSSRRRHTRCSRDWSSDVCSSDLWFSRSQSGLQSPDWFGQTTTRAPAGLRTTCAGCSRNCATADFTRAKSMAPTAVRDRKSVV